MTYASTEAARHRSGQGVQSCPMLDGLAKISGRDMQHADSARLPSPRLALCSLTATLQWLNSGDT
ncbi:hypothetical protein BAUCODRAFT_29023 [Baudoinia panamericana UAMH 10762]|uniref:Uncharacterized protein n=1 Tax=Baudoinia panamericana (strain UAMH 10762) TaxID=717646 RepID=M2NN68_BAUPA|nr:uncharacterized protein BAUCODRAFT_29023 [Baudoinia panamericana UAMH 10762]EMD00671.1 hypothetical protein BAUCODRAFT_29023 [Baudoinia panamericana UAMH 10762]